MGTHSHCHRLLACGEMHLTGNQTSGDVERGELVGEVDLPDALLEPADLHHRLVHVDQVFPGNVHDEPPFSGPVARTR
jgi:hypothetical protein